MFAKAFKRQDANFFSKLEKVDTGYKNESGKTSKCWEWRGATFSNGYGRLGTPVETKNELIQRTHRYAFYLANGKIKKGLSVLHKCDNRICCNPKHLYQGDHRQNMRDMTARGKQALGSKSGKSVFIEDDITFIRAFYKAGFTYAALMEMYDSAKSTLHNIVTYQVWNHVGDSDPSEKRILKYIKSRKKRGCPLVAPVLRNAGSSSSIKHCSVRSLREVIGVFGQEKFAQMIKSSRKKIRVILESSDNTMVEINPSTGDMKVFTESKGDISPQRIVELISM